jgi:hypothetical protein
MDIDEILKWNLPISYEEKYESAADSILSRVLFYENEQKLKRISVDKYSLLHLQGNIWRSAYYQVVNKNSKGLYTNRSC